MRLINCLFFFIVFSMSIYVGEGQAASGVNQNDTVGLQVYFLGLSQGEASLVQFPNGYTLLIDTGAKESSKELHDFLIEHQVTKIDTMVLTGLMNGHLGGTEEVLRQFPVDRILLPDPLVQTIQNKITIPPEKIEGLKEGNTLTFPLGVQLRVLHPGDALLLSPEGNSLAFQLIHHRVKFLFTSDINEQAEEKLVEKYNVKSQILKVSDSGSSQASSTMFIEHVDPHAAIIFSDLPARVSKKVMERLSETWIDIYQTKRHGTISVISNGESYQIQKENHNGYFKDLRDQGKP